MILEHSIGASGIAVRLNETLILEFWKRHQFLLNFAQASYTCFLCWKPEPPSVILHMAHGLGL